MTFTAVAYDDVVHVPFLPSNWRASWQRLAARTMEIEAVRFSQFSTPDRAGLMEEKDRRFFLISTLPASQYAV